MDDLSPRDAAERWLDKRRPELRESSLSSIWYRLKLFVEYCEREGIDSMATLDGWTIDEYEIERRAKAKAITLEQELGTLKQWLEYCASIGIIDESVPGAVRPPTASKHEQTDDTKLDADAAEQLLAHYRDGHDRAARAHAMLEVLWTVGCRAGGLVALDLRDFDREEQWLRFVHRPDAETTLKNGVDGERYVGLLDETAAVLAEYVDQRREDRYDDHGRQPLIPSQQGRPQPQTVRYWCYLATQPCVHSPCPHEREMDTCEYRSYAQSSGCPSSRAPHHVRTGSITWQLSRGVPLETVAERVNSSPETIRKHYDNEDPRRELEQRRRQHLDNLELDNDN